MKYALFILILTGFDSPVDQHMLSIPVNSKELCEKARTQLEKENVRAFTTCLEVLE